jgi:hypothetical protein
METLLTTGFVRSITEKSSSYGNGSDEPIVQVLHTDNGRFQTFSSGFDSVKIVCLTVIDRDGNRLLARVAAHLTDTAVHLRPGNVLRLRVFKDMLMKPHANSPPTAVIVVVQMDVIGSGPFLMSEEDMITPTLDAMPAEPAAMTTEPRPFQDEQHEPPPIPEQWCTYHNSQCSMYGLNFRHCICEKTPVSEQDLTSIKTSCPFANGDSATGGT